MSPISRFKFFLWYFSHFKVPLIGHLHPKIVVLTDQKLVIKLPLTRRSKNHLQSMYFGALAVGSDVAGGLLGFYHAKKQNVKVSLAFKSFQADFIKRPESDVYFVCEEGELIQEMISKAKQSGERINQRISIGGFTHYLENPTQVALFSLELSLKIPSINRST